VGKITETKVPKNWKFFVKDFVSWGQDAKQDKLRSANFKTSKAKNQNKQKPKKLKQKQKNL